MVSRDEAERFLETAEEFLRGGVFRGRARLLADVPEDDDSIYVAPTVDRLKEILLGVKFLSRKVGIAEESDAERPFRRGRPSDL